jgi:hypothetical protein
LTEQRAHQLGKRPAFPNIKQQGANTSLGIAGLWCIPLALHPDPQRDLTWYMLLMQAKEGFKKMVGLQREVPAWHKLLTERLAGDVHMIGPTISCEGTPRDGSPAAEWRTLPHVQSHAIAVDQVR